MKPALNKVLPAMGINQHFPHAVVHRPKSHQCIAIPNLFMEQLISHVTMMLRFGPQRDNPAGQLLQANLEAFRLEAGLSGQIFGFPVEIKMYMMQLWIKHTWQHCREWDINIMMDLEDFETPRQNDKELMKIFLQYGTSRHDLVNLN